MSLEHRPSKEEEEVQTEAEEEVAEEVEKDMIHLRPRHIRKQDQI